MKAIALMLAASVALGSLALVACKKEDSADTGRGTDSASPAGGGMSIDNVNQAAKDAAAKAKQALDDLKTKYSSEIATIESGLTSLKTRAVALKDQELDGLVSKLESKVGEVKASLKSIIDGGSTTSKDTVTKLVDEAKALFGQATERADSLDG